MVKQILLAKFYANISSKNFKYAKERKAVNIEFGYVFPDLE